MVALAGALAPDPDILILDEPTAYLDPYGRRSVLDALNEVVRRGKAVLLITHDMEEAALADRVALIHNGRIERVSRPLRFFTDRTGLEAVRLRQPFSARLWNTLTEEGISIMDPLLDLDALVPMLVQHAGNVHRRRATGGSSECDHGGPAVFPSAMEFQDIGFRYGTGGEADGDVLDGFDLNIPKTSFSVLVGANGAGKSTLLQMSNGLLEPDRGRILINGLTMDETRRLPGGVPSRVALLFQNPERQVFSDTVYDDIAFGPRNLGRTEAEVRTSVEQALTWVGLAAETLQRSPFHLSGGQLRRVAVAGVLAMGSDVLVLDEPTDGLDPAGVDEFMSRVGEYITRTGSTVLLATHRVPEQMEGVDLLATLGEGRIRGCGAPSRVLFSPDPSLALDFYPSHVRVQVELLRCGIDIGEPSLDPGEAARIVAQTLRKGTGRGEE